MKTRKSILPVMAVLLLAGCGGENRSDGFVRMSTLHAIEVESVSMIAEESGNDKMLLRIPCTAWLGVDLDEVEYDSSNPKRLVVKLPPIHVSSPKVHHDRERVLDERKSIWSSPNVAQSLKEKAERKAQAEVEAIAMDREAVKLAKAQTERLIKCFYKQSAPDMEVSIEWKKD